MFLIFRKVILAKIFIIILYRFFIIMKSPLQQEYKELLHKNFKH